MSDLNTLTDEELVSLRVAVATEQERRARVADALDALAALARDAKDSGVAAETIRAAVEAGLSEPTETEPTETEQED